MKETVENGDERWSDIWGHLVKCKVKVDDDKNIWSDS